MRTVRQLAFECFELGIRVTAVLVGAAGWCHMQPGPFVEPHMSWKRAPDRFGVTPEFEAVFEIARFFPENGVIVDRDRLLALVLVPNRPPPCTGRAILQGPDKLRGRKWAAIVQHADKK